MLRLLFLLLSMTIVAPATAQTPLAELPLGNAAEFAGDTHIIVTATIPEGRSDVAYADELAQRHGLSVSAIWPLRSLDVICFVFEAKSIPDSVLTALSATDGVFDAYRIGSFETLAEPRYRDAYIQIQDGLRDMRVLPAHQYSTGKGVSVALIDTAVAVDHPDLASQNLASRNFVSRSPVAGLAERHGTAMAAIIAADAMNGEGMVGVAPDVELMALRACWEDVKGGKGRCNTFSLARALNFAILNKADVINFSITGPSDPIVNQLIAAALRRNILVVMAAPPQPGPALSDEVPGAVIAASNVRDGAVLAPGVEVLSAMPMEDYDFYSGSSVAAAHVSGALALLRALLPDASAAELSAALTIASEYGKRVVDLCAALQLLSATPPACNS